MKIAVIDTETTGLLIPGAALEKQPLVIELGIAIVENGQVTSEHNWLVDPGCELPPEITKITGLTTDAVAGQPSFKAVWIGDGAGELIAGCDAALAHNMPFDRGMIDNEVERMTGKPFQRWPAMMLCSAAEFEHAFGRRPRMKELYERYVGRPLDQTHRAIDDVRALVLALQRAGFFDELSME